LIEDDYLVNIVESAFAFSLNNA